MQPSMQVQYFMKESTGFVSEWRENDRKSFFLQWQSVKNPIQGFRFVCTPLYWEDTYLEETNMYDMRLVKHEDGWIYGILLF